MELPDTADDLSEVHPANVDVPMIAVTAFNFFKKVRRLMDLLDLLSSFIDDYLKYFRFSKLGFSLPFSMSWMMATTRSFMGVGHPTFRP